MLLNRLQKIPGIDLYAAEELLAEIGPTAATFPTAEHFASWAVFAPAARNPRASNYSRRSAKGNRYLRRLLAQIAWAAIHKKKSFFESLFARLRPKIDAKGAAWAVAHRIAKILWRLLHNGVEYQDRGADPADPRTLHRKFRRLMQEFGRHGIDVKALLQQQGIATP